MIAVFGKQGQLGAGRGRHPADDESHRYSVRFTGDGCVVGLGHVGRAFHPVREGGQSASGMASMMFRMLGCWRMVMEKRTFVFR